MNKFYIKRLEKELDERFEMVLETEKRMGNIGDEFLKNNPDYIFYKGMLNTILWLDFNYIRKEGKHKLFK